MSPKAVFLAAAAVGLVVSAIVYLTRAQRDADSEGSMGRPDTAAAASGADEPLGERADEIARASSSDGIDGARDQARGRNEITDAQELRRQLPEAPARQAAESVLPSQGTGSSLEDLQLEVVAGIPGFAAIVREFAAERADPTWSEATEARILGEISQATGLGAIDIQVECRTAICRVYLVGPRTAPDASAVFLPDLIAALGLEPGWMWAGPDRDGEPYNLFYFRREGTAPAEPGTQPAEPGAQ